MLVQSAHPAMFRTSVRDALESLAMHYGKLKIYSAGWPGFPANFTRDGILSAILLEDAVMLRNQLIFSSLSQGYTRNPRTGEEPGKIFHEMPGARIRGLSTEYNACDTTALFIYGHEMYLSMTHDGTFIQRQKPYLEKAVEYILSHLVNNLFAEDPKYCGAKQFALRVTYWKDSHVHTRKQGVPAYPVVYTLAHVQNMRALKSAAKLLHAPDLLRKAQTMRKHLGILYNDKLGVYNIGVDQQGFLTTVSSDSLHMLYYLEPGDIPAERAFRIQKAVEVLETPIGYRTLGPHTTGISNLGEAEEVYHAGAVWPFEQAFINIGARKFGLSHVVEVSARMAANIQNTFPELFVLGEDGFKAGGTEKQLWTIAASKYFAETRNSNIKYA